MKGQPFHRRLVFALHGVKQAFVRERSFRTHVAAAAGVAFAVLLLKPSAVWCAILVLTIGLVLVAELVNSAFEALIDHLHPEEHPEIGAAKDIAAGAVLLASGIAVAVGIVFIIDWANH